MEDAPSTTTFPCDNSLEPGYAPDEPTICKRLVKYLLRCGIGVSDLGHPIIRTKAHSHEKESFYPLRYQSSPKSAVNSPSVRRDKACFLFWQALSKAKCQTALVDNK